MNHGSSDHKGASSSSFHQPSNLCSIFRAPPSMRMVDEDNYIPKLVSIGPLHRKNPSLRAMEAHKLRFLDRLLNRLGRSLDSLKRCMKEFEKKTRESYFEDFDEMSSDEFVEMMVIDGCFVVELLRSFVGNLEEIPDPIFSTHFMPPLLRLDLLLFENQLPLFVLQELYTLTSESLCAIPLNDLAIMFFSNLVPGREDTELSHYCDTGKEHEHLLALFQSSFIRKTNYPPRIPSEKWFGSAMELMCAGIKFEKGDGCYLDVVFEGKKLRIPPLFLDLVTPQILRNAVAYEQCNTTVVPYFTSLVVFFDCLVDSAQEVKYLRRKGIINHILGSDEEATEVLNKLSKGVCVSNYACYISEEVEKINTFTKSRWAVWRGTLYLYYFLNQEPLNLLLFYLTIIQTISSLYQIIFDSIQSKHS